MANFLLSRGWVLIEQTSRNLEWWERAWDISLILAPCEIIGSDGEALRLLKLEHSKILKNYREKLSKIGFPGQNFYS